ncbi:MAG: hypothetical protein AAF720_01515 [Pseudomonadota bacterium]
MAETKGESSNPSAQTRDCASPGQGALSEARAQHASREICKLAEEEGFSSNSIFSDLKHWESQLQAENIEFGEDAA